MPLILPRRGYQQKPALGSVLDPTHPHNIGRVGCYLLNEGAGQTIGDLSGVLGALPWSRGSGNPAWSPGPRNICYSGNGTAYGFQSPAAPAVLPLFPAVSMEAWIVPVVTTVRIAFIFGSSTTNAFQLATFSSSRFNFECANSTGTNYSLSTAASTFVAGNLYHLFGVWDVPNNLLRLYVNGVQNVTLATTGTPAVPASTWRVGVGAQYTGSADAFSGLIESVSLWNRVFAPSEVAERYSDPYGDIWTPGRIWVLGKSSGGTTIVSATDAGAGAAATTLHTTETAADAGSGAAIAALLAKLMAMDAGVGAAAETLVAKLTVTDVGSGLAAVSLLVKLTAAGAGSGLAAAAALLKLTAADAGAGAAAVTLLAKLAAADVGSGLAAAALLARLTATDAGTGAAVAALVRDISAADAGSGSDAAALKRLVAAADSGSGIGLTSLRTIFAEIDSGHGADGAVSVPPVAAQARRPVAYLIRI